MIEETLVYHVNDKKHNAALFTEEKAKRPIVLVCPAWMGLDDFAKNKAKELAEKGYVGIALDVYGEAKKVDTPEEATELMIPLFTERKELRKRLIAGLEAARSLDWADTGKIWVIGFCFGGLCAIELLKSGAPIKGAVSFHGLLSDTLGEVDAETEKTEKVHGKLLVLHGSQDPLAPMLHVEDFVHEMTEADVDWEIDLYPAAHAFTNPDADMPESGLKYNEKAAKRAFERMYAFFNQP
ncbi:MAG: dienelactone hydrolase family protein [Chlamydiia bacterium]|nr:dienelactone hydrolase family protein [Chlamydiia bacterium]